VSSGSDTTGVDNANADDLVNNPAKLKLLGLVSGKNLDVLTDRHHANKLWISGSERATNRYDLGDDDIGTEDVTVKTGLKKLTLGDRIDL
jgi:hypothetical protein